MAIFAIILQPGANGEHLPHSIATAVGEGKFLKIADGSWLVSDRGTAQDLSGRIGITEDHAGSAVVLEIASYYGRANPAIWSWIKTNWEGAPLG